MLADRTTSLTALAALAGPHGPVTQYHSLHLLDFFFFFCAGAILSGNNVAINKTPEFEFELIIIINLWQPLQTLFWR